MAAQKKQGIGGVLIWVVIVIAALALSLTACREHEASEAASKDMDEKKTEGTAETTKAGGTIWLKWMLNPWANMSMSPFLRLSRMAAS